MMTSMAQGRVLKGVIQDASNGELLIGATIQEKGTTNGTVTDYNGYYEMELITANPVVIVNFVGYQTQELTVDGQSELNIDLEVDLEGLEEVVVVGFGEQKKASLVSSITSVNVENIKLPSSNFTNSIAGQVSGMIAFQQSGEPGRGSDNTSFFIRGLSTFGSGKQNPLILIDGVESTTTDMARLQADDISDFSVLKDAAASSIYGARGANGVVLINTKLGKQGVTKYSFRAESRISSNTKNFQLSDNITYMELENEALTTRNPELLPRYSTNKITATADGKDPYLYPNNDWLKQLIKPYTWNQGYNMNISGGTEKGRYYIAGTYNVDNGNLRVDPINDFNNNIKLQNYSVRSNIDLNLTPTTTLITRIYGQFDDYTGPIGGNIFDRNQNRVRYASGGEYIFLHSVWTNPVLFPAVYPKEKLPYVQHPLFGTSLVTSGNSSTAMVNPYALMVRGYQTYKTSNMMPQIELRQKLDFVTKGLSFRGMSYLRRVSFYQQDRSYDPFYYTVDEIDTDGNYTIKAINDGSVEGVILEPGTEYLDYSESGKDVNSQFWLQTAVDYNRVFNDVHSVGGMLLYYQSHYESGNPGNLINSLPNRNQGVSGRFTYGFDNRYMVELNFGYNGSERFAKSNRWGFFPSAGLGYLISNESFFAGLKNTVSNLKLRATYGIVGNDQIGDVNERFLYLSNVNLNDLRYRAQFGEGIGPLNARPGVSISRYANDNITWEVSKQLNLGMDLGMFDNKLNLIVDVFEQKRSKILQPVSNVDATLGFTAVPLSNYGKASSRGIDLSLDANRRLTRELIMTVRGTFTYATSKIIKTDELIYPEELSYLSRKGYSIKQEWGYIAERLFHDDEEVANSPTQFEAVNVMGGDIKYRDINGDGIINTDDQVPIGYPTQPEIIYGFGGSFLYKGFDFNFYFQGAARSSFFIDPINISPFVRRGGLQNRVLEPIAEDHWSEGNPNEYAFWPRLSTEYIGSNMVRSSWWLRNGSFLRLKRVDVGYNFDYEQVSKIGLKGARLYVSGINLLMFSKFDLWDVEMGGNGLGYPIQSTYTLGMTLDF
ncbi:TonB-dependent receptor [Marinoscillum sp. MHG1-6]|uniref:SusC/RagA family TonB-linked outer membrane protein n=1 Tax=Marinoscillum sp. MHG1-6 TaxID=2959627 RepID=UPI0021575853|nr:TonB-dependent receptor [Marinoscillum sp. MHG1-6]